MRNRPLFLLWALVVSLSTVIIAALAVGVGGRVHGAPLFVAGGVLVLTALASAYSGRLFWEADKIPERKQAAAKRLLHDASRVHFAAELCQIFGLVGAATGFYLIATSVHGDAPAQEAARQIINGIGAGLLATITGVFCSVVLLLQHHILTHALER